jgi:hypothetical protein
MFDFFGKHTCDESCMYASKERCVCHCKGKNHQSKTVTPESDKYRRLDRFLQFKPDNQQYALHTVIEAENILHELTNNKPDNYFFQFNRDDWLVLWMSPWFFIGDFDKQLDERIRKRTHAIGDSWSETHGNRIYFPINAETYAE